MKKIWKHYYYSGVGVDNVCPACQEAYEAKAPKNRQEWPHKIAKDARCSECGRR